MLIVLIVSRLLLIGLLWLLIIAHFISTTTTICTSVYNLTSIELDVTILFFIGIANHSFLAKVVIIWWTAYSPNGTCCSYLRQSIILTVGTNESLRNGFAVLPWLRKATYNSSIKSCIIGIVDWSCRRNLSTRLWLLINNLLLYQYQFTCWLKLTTPAAYESIMLLWYTF
jgi:hypothetical protein